MNYYSLFIFLAIILVIYVVKKMTAHLFDHEFFWKLSFFSFIFGLIGAKIFHILENLSFYAESPNLIFSGFGFSILGGITFAFLTIYIMSIIFKTKVFPITDKIFLVTPIAQIIGRIGNITNQELLPFSIYEMGLNLINFIILLFASRFKKSEGLVTALYFLNYGALRLYIEILKGNYLGFLALISFIFLIYGISKFTKIVFKL